jgi:hypothetical protein
MTLSNYVCNVPPYKVHVPAYAFGEYEEDEVFEAYLVSVKSQRGCALKWEVYVPKFGALYDKIPIDHLFHSDAYEPGPLHDTSNLQLWDCFSNTITIVVKDFLKDLPVLCRLKDDTVVSGEYKFTIDWVPDSVSDLVQFNEHHKSANVCFLENGQICALPNNRVRFIEPSLTPKGELPIPPFKVQSIDYKCESDVEFRLGDTMEWSY